MWEFLVRKVGQQQTSHLHRLQQTSQTQLTSSVCKVEVANIKGTDLSGELLPVIDESVHACWNYT